jgi:hypothetical protein
MANCAFFTKTLKDVILQNVSEELQAQPTTGDVDNEQSVSAAPKAIGSVCEIDYLQTIDCEFFSTSLVNYG